MAKEEGSGKNVRRKSRKLRYFYLNGQLHRSLHINRSTDIITTWCYPEERRIAYTYSDVLRRMGKAFTTQEVCKMVNRSLRTIMYAIEDGHIEAPQFTYGLNEHKKKFKYMWSEEDVMNLHSYLLTVHRGRPRKDGLITVAAMPSARELRALMRYGEITYVKIDGNFAPILDRDN